MNIKEERMQWKHDSANVDRFVDHMVDVLKTQADAVPVAYMAIDMPYRQFLQWLHSAQISRTDAELVRNSAVHLVNVMILELAHRMGGRTDGRKLPKNDWVADFLADLSVELSEDMALLQARETPSAPQ